MDILKLEKMESKANNGAGITCVKNIIFFIKKGELDKAKSKFSWDGDKVTQYPEINLYLINNLGCRTHGIVNCENELCIYMKKLSEYEKTIGKT